MSALTVTSGPGTVTLTVQLPGALFQLNLSPRDADGLASALTRAAIDAGRPRGSVPPGLVLAGGSTVKGGES